MGALLIAQETEIAEFVSALFRYSDEGTVIALRSFPHDEDRPQPRIQGWPVIRDGMAEVIRAATKAANEAANDPQPMVFCPPVATFQPTRRAREEDLANGVAISVEIDRGDTRSAKTKLEHLLGPVTIAVASGGEWTDPDNGEVFPKLHLHWRLSEVTKTPEDHKRLKQARDLAMVLVGADPSAVPLVHPLRWPGSWHRKGKPKLAMRLAGNPAAEVHLDDALTKLEEAVEAAGLAMGVSDHTGPRTPGEPQSPIERLRPAVMAIPNPDLHWDEWVKVGLLIHRATGRSEAGLDLWIEWSKQANKYADGDCEERWAHFHSHPLKTAGAGTLYYRAKAHGWLPPERHDDSHLADPNYWASVEADYGTIADVADQAAGLRPGTKAIWITDDVWDEAHLPLRPWVAKGYLMRGSVSLAAGMGSAGKSSLGVAWAIALVLGRRWSRFRPAGPEIVSIYNVEDDDDEQKRRISATLRQFKAAPAALKGRLHRLGPTNVGTLIERDPQTNKLRFTDAMGELIAHIEAVRPGVLILDPLIELHNADENDNTALRAVMATLRALAIRFKMAVLLVHHARKGSAGAAGDPDMIRGAGAIVGAARIAITVSTMTEEEADDMNVPADERSLYFRADGAKQNYARIEQAEWFKRVEYELGNGEPVAATEPWRPPNVWRDTPTTSVNEVLDRIELGFEPGVLFAATKRGNGSRRWAGFPVMDVLGVNEAQAKTMIETWLRDGLLEEREFIHPHRREKAMGVRVNLTKRPA